MFNPIQSDKSADLLIFSPARLCRVKRERFGSHLIAFFVTILNPKIPKWTNRCPEISGVVGRGRVTEWVTSSVGHGHVTTTSYPIV